MGTLQQLYIEAVTKTGEPPAGSYLSRIPAIRNLHTLPLHKPVTFFVGENGSGKSTLLEAIATASGLNAEGGSRNFCFSTADTHSRFDEQLRLVKGPYRPRDSFFLRAESFYNVATVLDRYEDADLLNAYGGVSLHEQSHGESFLSLVLERFRGRGLYLLDEPEAALSPSRQMTLLSRIDELVRLDSQLLIATHSPILMAYPNAEILLLDNGPIRAVAYEQTEHYQLTRRFLENPSSMLKILLDTKNKN